METIETMGTLRRTNMCGELSINDIGKEVVLMGWVQKRRSLGGLIFADLRDITGLIQIVFDTEVNNEAFEKAESLRSEFVIAVRGEVLERQSKNSEMATGEYRSLYRKKLKIFKITAENSTYFILRIMMNVLLNKCVLKIIDFLDLRKPHMQKNLMIRSKTSKVIRDFLYDNGFNEIETPVLGKPTPEGDKGLLSTKQSKSWEILCIASITSVI